MLLPALPEALELYVKNRVSLCLQLEDARDVGGAGVESLNWLSESSHFSFAKPPILLFEIAIIHSCILFC